MALPGNRSLKSKRAVVRRILDRARNRFNVAGAEVDHLDSKTTMGLGFAVVSNSGRHASSMLDSIGNFVQTATEAVTTNRSAELLHLNEFFDQPPAAQHVEPR
ncbi:MAG: DUF503 domain-containing protein [Proteobacteria bacterium]|nr:DUF503 domain-containing protein [Pseudomonadota bacterium]